MKHAEMVIELADNIRCLRDYSCGSTPNTVSICRRPHRFKTTSRLIAFAHRALLSTLQDQS